LRSNEEDSKKGPMWSLNAVSAISKNVRRWDRVNRERGGDVKLRMRDHGMTQGKMIGRS
jgi:hypothetical protein